MTVSVLSILLLVMKNAFLESGRERKRRDNKILSSLKYCQLAWPPMVQPGPLRQSLRGTGRRLDLEL